MSQVGLVDINSTGERSIHCVHPASQLICMNKANVIVTVRPMNILLWLLFCHWLLESIVAICQVVKSFCAPGHIPYLSFG